MLSRNWCEPERLEKRGRAPCESAARRDLPPFAYKNRCPRSALVPAAASATLRATTAGGSGSTSTRSTRRAPLAAARATWGCHRGCSAARTAWSCHRGRSATRTARGCHRGRSAAHTARGCHRGRSATHTAGWAIHPCSADTHRRSGMRAGCDSGVIDRRQV
jgi:hypothetical protein